MSVNARGPINYSAGTRDRMQRRKGVLTCLTYSSDHGIASDDYFLRDLAI